MALAANAPSRSIGERLKSWRMTRRVSQAGLARYLGVARNTVIRWENGSVRMEHEDLVRRALEHWDCLHGGRF
jgi:transcriptional regulator with XRE-family HTH domain